MSSLNKYRRTDESFMERCLIIQLQSLILMTIARSIRAFHQHHPSVSPFVIIRVYYFSINRQTGGKNCPLNLLTNFMSLFSPSPFLVDRITINLTKKCTSNKINTCLFKKDEKKLKKKPHEWRWRNKNK